MSVMDWRPRDAVGRLIPRQTDAVMLFRGVPGLAARFDTLVPDEYVHRASQVRSRMLGCVVDCPCGGHSLFLRPGGIDRCDGGCGRVFVNTGLTVRVARESDG